MAWSPWRVLTVLLPVLLCLSPARQAGAGPTQITVMTQNLYTGADTNPILMAATLPELQNAIKAAAQSVIDNNFPLRAAAIAAEAAKAGGPLLIGLQEAEIVGQAGVTLNYADAVIAALKAQGLNYTYMIPGVGATVHTGLSLDSAAAGLPGFVTLTDQDVVLVRTDFPGTPGPHRARYLVKSRSSVVTCWWTQHSMECRCNSSRRIWMGLSLQRSPPRSTKFSRPLAPPADRNSWWATSMPPVAICAPGCRADRRNCLQPASPTPALGSDRHVVSHLISAILSPSLTGSTITSSKGVSPPSIWLL
jgi:hypothetical protein